MDLMTLTCAGMLCVVDFPGKALVSRDEEHSPVTQQIECIAKNVQMEARGESDLGKIAIISVVLNRMRNSQRWDRKGKGDACHVVYAKRQFSWTSQNDSQDWLQRWAAPSAYEMRFAEIAVREALQGNWDPTHGADHYVTLSLYNGEMGNSRMGWVESAKRGRGMEETQRIAGHVFFRAK